MEAFQLIFLIVIPFPNILFIPRSPKAETAPVTNAGTGFEILLLRKAVILFQGIRVM